MPLPSFTIVGTLFDVLGDTLAGELVETGAASTTITFTPNLSLTQQFTWDGDLYRIRPVAAVLTGTGITRSGDPVRLLANDDGLNVSGIQWQVKVATPGLPTPHAFWFDAPSDGDTIDLSAVTPVPGTSVNPVGEGLTEAELLALIEDETSGVRRALSAALPQRISRNNWCGILGDSFSIWGDPGDPPYNIPSTHYGTYHTLLCGHSNGRILNWGARGHGGATIRDTLIETYLPPILALDPEDRPGALILHCGAGDGILATPTPLATAYADYRELLGLVRDAGIMPIAVTLAPATVLFGGVDVDTYNVRVLKWNAWIRRLGAKEGIPLIDNYTALTGSDGSWKSAAYTIDGLHPTYNYGHPAMAQQALSDGLLDWFPPVGYQPTSRSPIDSATMLWNGSTLNLGLFTTGTPTPTGFGFSDFATVGMTAGGIVTPTTSDDLVGKWWELRRLKGTDNNFCWGTKNFASGWSVGDTLQMSARVQSENCAATASFFNVSLRCTIPGGWIPPGVGADDSLTSMDSGLTATDVDISGIYTEVVDFVIPAVTTSLDLLYTLAQGSTGSGTAKLRIGELTIRNLTTGGLLA